MRGSETDALPLTTHMRDECVHTRRRTFMGCTHAGAAVAAAASSPCQLFGSTGIHTAGAVAAADHKVCQPWQAEAGGQHQLVTSCSGTRSTGPSSWWPARL